MINPQKSAIRYVVFTGPSQSGKSTVAALLVTTLRGRGLAAMQTSFETPMLSYLTSLLGRKLSRSQMDEPVSELLSKTPRDFLNREAQHMRFTYGPGVLGRLLVARSKRWTHPPRYVIVDDGTSILDCRELGGRVFLIGVLRDRVERVYPLMIPNVNMVIRNDAGISNLRLWAEKVADALEEATRGV